MSNAAGWIGVDLDGTLAVYDGWKGIEHIGRPVPRVVNYVLGLLRAGVDVRIFTSRLQEEGAVRYIDRWCLMVFGQTLPVTDRKDFSMVAMVDDRAYPVEPNTGKILRPLPSVEEITGHWSSPLAPPAEEFKKS